MNNKKLISAVDQYLTLIKYSNYKLNDYNYSRIISFVKNINNNLLKISNKLDNWQNVTEQMSSELENNFEEDQIYCFDSINEVNSESIGTYLYNIFFELKDIFLIFNLKKSVDKIEYLKEMYLINKSEDAVNFIYPRNNLNKIQQINIVDVINKLSECLLEGYDPVDLWYKFTEKMEEFFLELLSFCQQIYPNESDMLESGFKNLLNNFEQEGKALGEKFKNDYPINLENFDEEDLEY